MIACELDLKFMCLTNFQFVKFERLKSTSFGFVFESIIVSCLILRLARFLFAVVRIELETVLVWSHSTMSLMILSADGIGSLCR